MTEKLMAESSSFITYRKPLLIYCIFLILLFSASALLYFQQRKTILDNRSSHLETETSLIEIVSRFAMANSDYKAIHSYINKFGAENPDIIEVSLRDNNGLRLVDYKKNVRNIDILELSHEIKVNEKPVAFLSVKGDMMFEATHLKILYRQLGVSCFLLAAVVGYLLRVSYLRKQEAVSLRNRTEELDKANRDLKHEIAERVIAKKELSQANSEIEQVFETAVDGLRIIDREYNVLRFNKALLSMCDLIHDDAVGLKCYEMFPGPRCHTDECPLALIINGAGNLDYETEKKKHNGTIIPCQVTATPFTNSEGEIIGIVEDFKDITERRRTENALRHAQKMEAIGTLAGGIAHDFNNILNAIMGYTQLTMYELAPESSSHTNLKEVLKASKRATDLVRQIQAFSRQTEHEKKPLAVQFVIKEALKLLRATLPATIEIRQQIDTECRPILADNTQIHQVIMNLCTNAYHAMREQGGVLSIQLSETNLTTKKTLVTGELAAGWYACMAIRDTAQGMDESTMQRMFEPYFTTKSRSEGSGLGLAMVHGIVKSHGGGIAVTCQPGKGTSFFIYLPLIIAEEEIQTGSEAVHNLPRLTGRVLLVDDEESVILLGTRVLQTLGCEVEGYTDSSAALNAFLASPAKYDLVITDQVMPGMNGMTLARKIVDSRPELPIILISGYMDVVKEDELRQSGIKQFMMKPIGVSELAKTAGKYLH